MIQQATTTEPRVLRLADGTEWRLSNLGPDDVAELDSWLQSRMVSIARNSLDTSMSPAEREETLNAAIRVAANSTALAGSGSPILSSIDGIVRVIWQQVKRNHPNVTHDDVRAKIFNPDNLRAMRDAAERSQRPVARATTKQGGKRKRRS